MGAEGTSRHTMQRAWMISLFLAFALSIPLNQEIIPSWVTICGGTYLFSEDDTTWDEAYGMCELFGGHLAQIDGLEENYCLLNYGQQAGFDEWYWNSANDREAEGVWRQYDGQLVLWTPWWWNDSPGPVLNGGGGDCGVVSLSGGPDAGKWHDKDCISDKTHQFPYI